MSKLIILFIILFLKFDFFSENDTLEENNIEETESESAEIENQKIQLGETFAKCYNELGCITINKNWFHEKFRPINFKPLEREIIKTEFILLKENKTENFAEKTITSQLITANKKSLENSEYKNGIFLFIFIHDFTSSGYAGWIKHMAKVLKIRTKESNTISVDWHAGAEPPYDQAISNARIVALEILHLIKFLKDQHDLNYDQVHLIGHGIGAHIAGYVGNEIKINKITGLDPSGPRFTGMSKSVRLDYSHANYVEVLHTNSLEDNPQGSGQLFGHTDFFLNNGENQPGCPKQQINFDLLSVTRDTLNEGEILPGCSHKRAYKYYIESFESEQCTFLGIKCKNYLDFRQGKCTKCGHNCRTFGIVKYPFPNRGSYFLQTNSKQPFCLFQYRVTVDIKSGTKSSYFGLFEFILIDSNHFTTTSSLTKLEQRKFIPGANNSFIFYASYPKMAKIVNAKIGWIEKRNFFCLINCKQSINVSKFIIENINGNSDKKTKKVSLCPMNDMMEIMNGEFQEFILCK